MKWSISKRNDIYFVNIHLEEKWLWYCILNSNTIRIYLNENEDEDDHIDITIPEFLPRIKIAMGTIYSYYHQQEKDVITIVYIPFSVGNMPQTILQSE